MSSSYPSNLASSLLGRFERFGGSAGLYVYRDHYDASLEAISQKYRNHSQSMRDFVLDNGVVLRVAYASHNTIDGTADVELTTISVDWGPAADEHRRLLEQLRTAKVMLESFEQEALSGNVASSKYVEA